MTKKASAHNEKEIKNVAYMKNERNKIFMRVKKTEGWHTKINKLYIFLFLWQER